LKYLDLLLAVFLFIVSRRVFYNLDYYVYEFIVLAIIPIIYIIVSKKKFSDYNLSLGDVGKGLKYTVLLIIVSLPFMLYGASLLEFQSYYPLWDDERNSFYSFIYYEVFVMGVLMFYTELFYRGFLLRSLSRKTRYGNLIQSIVYMYVHLGKPGLEVWWSLPAGFVFGEVDNKCKSILPSFLMHWLSSMLFNAMILYF